MLEQILNQSSLTSYKPGYLILDCNLTDIKEPEHKYFAKTLDGYNFPIDIIPLSFTIGSKTYGSNAYLCKPIRKIMKSEFENLFGFRSNCSDYRPDKYIYVFPKFRDKSVTEIVEIVETIPKSEFYSKKDSNIECGICFDQKDNTELITFQNCQHQVCQICTDKIKEHHDTLDGRCPFCRQKNSELGSSQSDSQEILEYHHQDKSSNIIHFTIWLMLVNGHLNSLDSVRNLETRLRDYFKSNLKIKNLLPCFEI